MEKKFRVVLEKNVSGKWYWKLVSAGNNEVLSVSEDYSSLQNCLHTANLLVENLSSAILVISESAQEDFKIHDEKA